MSRENVEVVRAAYEAWNAGDMDAYRELYDPDVIMRAIEGWPEPGPYVGREAVMRWLAQLRETWDADTLELTSDFIAAGDRVAVRQIWHGAGRGPEANMGMAVVFTVRDGRIFYVEFFWDHAKALEALGLPEPAMSQENVDIVKSTWQAWIRGDLDGVVASYAPDAVWDMTPFREWPDTVYTGPADMRRFLTEWLDVWDAFEVGVDKYLTAPDGRIVCLAWQRGKGRQSGLAMDMQWAMIVTVRDGQITRLENYDDRAKALEAAGLSE